MAITFTSRKGKVYYLCYRLNEKGTAVYFLSKRIKGELATAMPEGYAVEETVDGDIKLVKTRKATSSTVLPKEVKSSTSIRSSTDVPLRRKPVRGVSPKATCPVCKQSFGFARLKWHIKESHPFYTPSIAISESRRKDPSRKQRTVRPRRVNRESNSERTEAFVIQVEPFECGWCYKLIWRAWQKNGYYRYYDDRELTHKHRCTRPVRWQPDR